MKTKYAKWLSGGSSLHATQRRWQDRGEVVGDVVVFAERTIGAQKEEVEEMCGGCPGELLV